MIAILTIAVSNVDYRGKSLLMIAIINIEKK